jgi:hypothetical protein
MKIETVRQALLADLATVAGLTVYAEPIDQMNVKYPFAMVLPPEDAEAHTATMTARNTRVRLSFGVLLSVRSATPHADICHLFDSTSDAIEKNIPTPSTLNALTYVDMVDLSIGERVDLTSEDIADGRATWKTVATVEYHKTRGSS